MYKFGEHSKKHKATLDPRLQGIVDTAILYVDFRIQEGHRSGDKQQQMYDTGYSKAKPGESKHNFRPSKAMDLWFWPVQWPLENPQTHTQWLKHYNVLQMWWGFGQFILKIAESQGVDLNWGGNWKKFKDYPHFELID